MSESIGGSGRGPKLHTKILLGLVGGATLGVAGNLTLGADHPLVDAVNHYLANPVGQVFLRMLFMIVVPLVFASIALGVAGLGDIRRAGRVGGKAIGYFFGSTALAATLGLLLVGTIRPGDALEPSVRADLLATYSADASSRIEASAADLARPVGR